MALHANFYLTHVEHLNYLGIDEDNDGKDDVEDGHSCAFFTLDTLARTPNGVTCPIIVTFFASMSILNDVTPTTNSQLYKLDSSTYIYKVVKETCITPQVNNELILILHYYVDKYVARFIFLFILKN